MYESKNQSIFVFFTFLVSERDDTVTCMAINTRGHHPPLPLLTFFLPMFVPLVDVRLQIDAGPAGQTFTLTVRFFPASV